jgi:hypothetical protein
MAEPAPRLASQETPRRTNIFDAIRARSSVDALGMICRHHPEAEINVKALREELEAADEQINQLARALREAVEPQTFMGEPVSPSGGVWVEWEHECSQQGGRRVLTTLGRRCRACGLAAEDDDASLTHTETSTHVSLSE